MDVIFENLKIEINEQGSTAEIRFSGDVEDSFKNQDLPKITATKIRIDLSEIENFNSCGIREWIYFIKSLPTNAEIIFHHCSVTMMDQINMVPDCATRATIESFYAPYYCSNHGEKNQLIEVRSHLNQLLQKRSPDFKCDMCAKNLEFDALEESYFLFMEDFKSNAS